MMELQGASTAPGFRFAIIVSRFNPEVTDGLVSGALAALFEAGVRDDDITLVRVPGAFELPVAAQRLASSGRFDAIICLGCVIKGDTMHFEYISAAASQGIMDVSTSSGIPVAFGLLTTLDDEQARVRSLEGPGNKGREAAMAAVEMATLWRHIGEAGLHER
jgi:6,7-dimethyl-8-ribityllumazine synthase